MQDIEFTDEEIKEVQKKIVEVLLKAIEEKERPTLSQKVIKALGLTGY